MHNCRILFEDLPSWCHLSWQSGSHCILYARQCHEPTSSPEWDMVPANQLSKSSSRTSLTITTLAATPKQYPLPNKIMCFELVMNDATECVAFPTPPCRLNIRNWP